MKTSKYSFQKGLDSFHIIARYKSNIIIFICSEQGEQHLRHPQKHIFGESRGKYGGPNNWKVRLFGRFLNLENWAITCCFLLYLTIFTCIYLKHLFLLNYYIANFETEVSWWHGKKDYRHCLEWPVNKTPRKFAWTHPGFVWMVLNLIEELLSLHFSFLWLICDL